jgi:site-specific recombinase XerD
VDKQGHVPIYAKVNINSQVLLLSLNHRIPLKFWDNANEQPKNTCKDYLLILNALESFKSRIYQAYSKIIATNATLTTENLKSEFLGKETVVKVPMLIENVIKHNQHFESMIGIKYSYGSYKNYKTTLKYLQEFIPLTFKKKDIPLQEVNYSFSGAFFEFLTSSKSCGMNGANKQMQRLKKVMNETVRKGLLTSNPMSTFQLKFTPVNKQALSMTEVKKLADLKLTRDTLKNVRDVFLLQCYTGLSYSDVRRLTASDIYKEADGVLWIKMERLKTKIAFSVPLLKPAIKLLKGFGYGNGSEPFSLPVISNQKMNDNLKLIQELAGLDKGLTTHLARHTFATTVTLNNGIPLETVSRMLGHTKLSTTQRYAKVHEAKIGKDMEDLMDKFK